MSEIPTETEVMDEALSGVKNALAEHYTNVDEKFDFFAVGGKITVDAGPIAEKEEFLEDVRAVLEVAGFDARYDPFEETRVKVDVL